VRFSYRHVVTQIHGVTTIPGSARHFLAIFSICTNIVHGKEIVLLSRFHHVGDGGARDLPSTDPNPHEILALMLQLVAWESVRRVHAFVQILSLNVADPRE
jgi:hypothetical protein